MTPTIGRIVHVFHESEPAPAMITAVHANGDLSVTVFPAGAVPYPKTVSDSDWAWPKRDEPGQTPQTDPNAGTQPAPSGDPDEANAAQSEDTGGGSGSDT